MNTALVRDTVPDVSSSTTGPVTAVEDMDDNYDDDDRSPGEMLPSDSPHILKTSHSAPELSEYPAINQYDEHGGRINVIRV
jgi:hypothetical protein